MEHHGLMYWMNKWVNDGHCFMCGSQQCERTPQWIEGCQRFWEWMNSQERNKNE